ncbi:hypothetical protein [Pseudoduganella buxea]|uniref:Uncharacterized protein n=1 Tax=Pseudoduganella buxea TaxID=1949069 RepID=A0A6I3SXS0_9BURK|nr:hypothetical protein [Pseudoduganella buxea]MTV53874.1 hypothetical protein [Pseudoduganella buxea]
MILVSSSLTGRFPAFPSCVRRRQHVARLVGVAAGGGQGPQHASDNVILRRAAEVITVYCPGTCWACSAALVLICKDDVPANMLEHYLWNNLYTFSVIVDQKSMATSQASKTYQISMKHHTVILFTTIILFVGVADAQTLQRPTSELSCPPEKNESRREFNGGHGLGILEITPASMPRRYTGCKRIYSDNELIITYEFTAGVLSKAELGGPNNKPTLCRYDTKEQGVADSSGECKILKEMSVY